MLINEFSPDILYFMQHLASFQAWERGYAYQHCVQKESKIGSNILSGNKLIIITSTADSDQSNRKQTTLATNSAASLISRWLRNASWVVSVVMVVPSYLIGR